MKKSVVKNLRRLAKELPPCKVKRAANKRMSGTQLKAFLTEHKQPVPEHVKDELFYKVPVYEYVPVIHENNLKTVYKKHGMQGVVGYMNEVKKIVERSTQPAQVDQLGPETTDLLPEILNVPEGTLSAESGDLVPEADDVLSQGSGITGQDSPNS